MIHISDALPDPTLPMYPSLGPAISWALACSGTLWHVGRKRSWLNHQLCDKQQCHDSTNTKFELTFSPLLMAVPLLDYCIRMCTLLLVSSSSSCTRDECLGVQPQATCSRACVLEVLLERKIPAELPKKKKMLLLVLIIEIRNSFS